ncbi:MAG: O-antigen ligase family protein [Chloroflexi bacterium]|nr:O-antigen ligase family protein [Chloroflexota bacterium]
MLKTINLRLAGNRTLIDLAIEACWLAALALVPIAFSGRDVVVLFLQPKDFVLHLLALTILALWVIDWALGGYRPEVDLGSLTAIRRWLGRNPRNWALAAAGGFGVVAAISTILSPTPAVSLWGRDFAQLGYELYSVLSLLVIFFAIALRVREPDQVRRVLWAIAGAGAVTGAYGVSQHFGWDPIGNGAGDVRVLSTFANPIFFGSFLLMSTVVTLGLALDRTDDWRQWRPPVVVLLLTVQLAAMWFTGSRGPWLGLVFGLLVFAGLGAISLSRASLARAGAVIVAALVLAVMLVNIPTETSNAGGRDLGSIVAVTDLSAGTLGRRTDIWKGSARLLDSWEQQESESALASALRPVFGLGPEMFFYSYPLTANPQNGLEVVSHAHSFPLQVVLEVGIAGLVTFLTLTVAALATGLSFILRRGRRNDLAAVAMVAVIAALAGRSVEQAVGVARVGDLVPFWALLGLVLTVYVIGGGGSAEVKSDSRSRSARPAYGRLGLAAVVTVTALSIFVARDVQMLRSGLIAGDAFDESAGGNPIESLRLLRKAGDISPDVQQYGVWAGELLVEGARAQTDAAAAMEQLGDAYDAFIRYEKRDPIAFTTQLRIGLVESELVNRGDNFRLQDLIDRSVRLADAMPSYPEIQAFAAERVLIAGRLELGLALADRAIAMEAETSPQPFAWFMRGNALGDLGDLDGALEAFNTALDREPEGQFAPGVHRNMALVYDSIGDAAQAAEHRARADEIQAALAAAGAD